MPTRPSPLHRLGAACSRRPIPVVVLWLLALGLALAGQHLAHPTYSDAVSLPGSQSDTGGTLLARATPGATKYSGLVVLHAPTGSVGGQLSATADTARELAALPDVTSVSSLLTSTDGATTYWRLDFDVRPKTLGGGYPAALDRATAAVRRAGLQVAYGGDLDELTRPAGNDRAAELVGLAAALGVLLLAFGSVAGAVLPLASALVAVATGLSVVGLVAAAVDLATAAPTLAAMIGLGVGVDYGLFVTTRFRAHLVEGDDPERAAGRAIASSGHAVLLAAATVSVALLGLYGAGLSFIGRLGLAATISVVVAAAAAVTLVPAGLGLIGRRIDRLAVRRPVAETSGEEDGWQRYSALVARRPVLFLVGGLAVIAALSLPLGAMRLGHIDAGADPVGSTSRTAYDLVADAHGPGFGPGADGVLTVVVDLRGASEPAATISTRLSGALSATPGVAGATAPRPSADGTVLTSTVTPATDPQSAATSALYEQLLHHTLPDTLRGTQATGYVSGPTAGQLDFRDTISRRLPLIIGLVLAASFLLLMLVFRSLLIPLKAVLLNLFTTAASYGVLVAVFQWGWGGPLLGVHEAVPIESYVPMMMFAIVFGLSMDYEIFLLSSIAEAWHGGSGNTEAVGSGLARTARVITSAAVIMTAVFLSFASSPTVVIKMLSMGLAAGVVIDATLVRMVLVPSTMTLLGRANWWFPGRPTAG
ncbi:RND superfamily putative drug exporter [Kitasatospora sp. MAA4]|uniref:MMPL family transporter n=1 Tax=Kitasatospora sp. MAA4 TaxID=3035093 RepID=UPI002473DC8C|nr:MMPL family transporter [Kitasatospora sp. MAA4]MDH6133749.1 RND superfamily putative drug exporter [Kitasatospora sp. MAA4]